MSGESLKLLGFVFGREPGVAQHVIEIKRKFRARFWSLIHLRRAGFKGWQLFKLYMVFVRSVIEYCSVIYHPMLTKGQSEEIERLQRQVVKPCFGWEKSYRTICAEQDNKTLAERREDYIDNFVKKTVESPRFGQSWYPLREETTHNIRDRRPFKEAQSRTSRFYNSPLSNLRRRANDLASGNTRGDI